MIEFLDNWKFNSYDSILFFFIPVANQISLLYSYFNLVMKVLIICTIALKCSREYFLYQTWVTKMILPIKSLNYIRISIYLWKCWLFVQKHWSANQPQSGVNATMFYIKLSPKDDLANQITILYSYFNLVMKVLIICTKALRCESITIRRKRDYVLYQIESQRWSCQSNHYIIFVFQFSYESVDYLYKSIEVRINHNQA